MGPLRLKLHRYHPPPRPSSSRQASLQFQDIRERLFYLPVPGIGEDAEHCRESPPVSGLGDVSVLSPMLGEGDMTGEGKNVGRAEGMCMMVNGHLVESEGMS
jgi:hypothetical protein